MTEAIPELGPLLGRLASPAARGPECLPLDDLRFDLLTSLYAQGALARKAAEAGDAGAAAHALAPAEWLRLWRDAAGRAAERALAEIDHRLREAARVSRIPPKLLAARLPGGADGRTIRSRCESAGIPLEQVAESIADGLHQQLLRSAMALDESWERLIRVVEEEIADWEPEIVAVHDWRRPRAMLWTFTVGGLVAALLLGLSLGGYLPAPGPLGMLQRWWWSLPWP